LDDKELYEILFGDDPTTKLKKKLELEKLERIRKKKE